MTREDCVNRNVVFLGIPDDLSGGVRKRYICVGSQVNVTRGRVVVRGKLSHLASLAGVVLGIAALAGCGSGSIAAVPPGQVTEAAYQTMQGPGFSFALDMNLYFRGHHAKVIGEGALDEKTLRGVMKMSASGKAVRVILMSPYVYIQSPRRHLISGKSWVRINENVYAQAQGLGGGAPAYEPTQMVDLLKASGRVQQLEMVTVRGVRTRHYHALVNMGRYVLRADKVQRAQARRYSAFFKRATGSETLPMDAFVDGRGRVRRLVFKLVVCTSEGNATVSMAMDIYDYGRQRVPAAPPTSQVTDITNKLRRQIDQGLERLDCSHK